MAEGDALTFKAISALFWYSVCSSLLLIVNKVALKYIPVPSAVTLAQLVSCSLYIFSFRFTHPELVDAIEWSKVKPYALYVLSFSAGIYTNMKALEGSNVDTVIVFRCCTPLVVSMGEYIFLGRELPNTRSALALLLLVVGATGYVLSDNAFRMEGPAAYMWVTVYFFLLCFSMMYGKRITDSVPMKSMWGPALYSNFLSIAPTALMGLAAHEQDKMPAVVWTQEALFFLVLSCVLGVGISYTGWNARQHVSATLYTLVGVMNKLVTVAVNILIWDQHASATGLFWLTVCIVAGSVYQQSPMRAQPQPLGREALEKKGGDQQGHGVKMEHVPAEGS